MNIDDKPFQKNNLIMSFGMLIQPLEELAQTQSVPEVKDYLIAFAKMNAGEPKFNNKVKEFVTFSDVKYSQAELNVLVLIKFFNNRYRDKLNVVKLDNPKQFHDLFKKDFENLKLGFSEKVDSVPIDWQPKIFQANTPFTTYSCIMDCIVGVRNRLDFFDRYLKSEFFNLYLRNLDRSVSIRLVTTKGNSKNYGVENILSISELCRQEFDNYKLIQLDPNDFHDRNLRVDNQIFTLGSGTDQAGKYPTNFGPTESTPSAHQILDDLIAKGKIIHESN